MRPMDDSTYTFTRVVGGLGFSGSPSFVASHWAYVLGTFFRFGRV